MMLNTDSKDYQLILIDIVLMIPLRIGKGMDRDEMISKLLDSFVSWGWTTYIDCTTNKRGVYVYN